MDSLTRRYVRLREGVRAGLRGQTMTEYALILAAIAVVVYATYKTLGTDIGTMAATVESALTSS